MPQTRKRVPRAEREEQMLEVARREFAEHGYEAVSMDAIAEGVGVTKPMLYAYFDSKEGLFLACTARAQRELEEAVRDAMAHPGRPLDERVWRGIVAYFDFAERHREAWNLVYPEGSASTERFGSQVREQRKGLAEHLTGIFEQAALEEGLDADVARLGAPLAYAFVGAALALASWWADHPEEPKELLAMRLMNFVWTGLGATLRGELWLPPIPEEDR
ncbi:MAG TPA: TetR/AcrR family transcriptional regulator [Thermoleophilaceae bacterium]|nr:TetR/AcrR family transcriptional regulator [Thermoleophilaceae bacterium]